MEASGLLHVPATLPPGKELPVPIGKRLGGPQSRSGRGDEEKNSQPPPGIEPRSSSSYSVAIPTELSRLLFEIISESNERKQKDSNELRYYSHRIA
jgi:hypothetical protein